MSRDGAGGSLTLLTILRLVLAGVTAILLVALTWWAASCWAERKLDDRPPELIEEPEEVLEDMPDPDPGPIRRLIIREVQPSRKGTAPGGAKAEVDSFVKAAKDTTAEAVPLYVPFSGRLDKNDELTLWVPKSDGALERAEFPDCYPCDFGSTPLGGPYAQTPREVPKLLPEVAGTVLICGATAAAGYAIAAAVEYDHPGYVAGAAGGGCVLIRVVGR